jgi:hypothetical protein
LLKIYNNFPMKTCTKRGKCGRKVGKKSIGELNINALNPILFRLKAFCGVCFVSVNVFNSLCLIHCV